MARDSAVLEEPGAAPVRAAERAAEHASASRIETIDLSRIVESPDNPRTHFPADWIEELGASMLVSGQLTPALVRPHPTKKDHFELAAGASRYRAAKAKGIAVLLCVVRPMDDAQFLEVLIFENLKRRDLQPMEEARGYATLQKKLEGWTVERIAEKSGVSPDYVRDRLRLFKLIPEAAALLEAGTITLGHALELAKISAQHQRKAVGRGRGDGALWAATQERSSDQLGLEDDERTVRHVTVRSVRELRDWINTCVAVDLEHPELQHLLPETARRLEAAKVEQRKQVFISFGYVRPEVKGKQKVVGPQSWKKAENAAGEASCAHAVLGIVYAGDAARGHAFLVCTNKDRCKVHWAQHVKKREERERARRGELTTKGGKKISEAAVVQKQREAEAKEEQARKARREALDKAAPAIIDALVTAIEKANALTLAKQLDARPGRQAEKRVKKMPAKTLEDLVRRAVAAQHLRFWSLDEWTLDREVKPLGKSLGVDVNAILKEREPRPPKPAKPQGPNVPARVRAEVARVKAKVKATGKAVERKPNAQFMKPVIPDAVLAAVVGATPLTRTELTKKLWAYVKKHGLHDKKNKRMINADEKLKALFGGKAQVSMFDVTKIVSKHLVQESAA